MIYSVIALIVICLLLFLRLISLEKRVDGLNRLIDTLAKSLAETDSFTNRLARLVDTKSDRKVRKL